MPQYENCGIGSWLCRYYLFPEAAVKGLGYGSLISANSS